MSHINTVWGQSSDLLTVNLNPVLSRIECLRDKLHLASTFLSHSQATDFKMAVMIGYEVSLFKDEVDEELICTICGQVATLW